MRAMVDGERWPSYTAGEVLVLLSLDRKEALRDAGAVSSSIGRMSPGGKGKVGSSNPDDVGDVPMLARWSDVHGARRRVIARQMRDDGCSPDAVAVEMAILTLRADGVPPELVLEQIGVDRLAKSRDVDRERLDEILVMRAQGHTEAEIAAAVGMSLSTTRRRFQASLNAIISELGGNPGPAPADLDRGVAACMTCGQRPRARLAARRRRIKGGWKTMAPERQSSLCEICLQAKLEAR